MDYDLKSLYIGMLKDNCSVVRFESVDRYILETHREDPMDLYGTICGGYIVSYNLLTNFDISDTLDKLTQAQYKKHLEVEVIISK